MGILLPKLNSMSIKGFNKIFKEDIVEIDFSRSLNILLGGNGLGKTTILQCIVYALTGGTNNPEVETLKEFRWDNSFFRKRVNAEQLSNAKITIEFFISQKKFKVTRGLMKTRFEAYSEAHHIRPYNKTHKGDDTIGNMVVLCPNCHSQFDNLYYAIHPSTRLVHCLDEDDRFHLAKMEFIGEHELSEKYLTYTWKLFKKM